MKLVIAEKPSVAMSLAAVLSSRKQLRLATTAQRKLLQLTTTALLSTSVLTQQPWTA